MSPNRPRRSRRSRPSMADGRSSARSRRKHGRSSGRRGTTRTTPRSRCGRGPGAGRPTRACPISRLADCILETKQDISAFAPRRPLVGHVGDGNFHIIFPVNPDDPRDLAEAERLSTRLAERAISMGGTCIGRTWRRPGKDEVPRARARRSTGRHARDQANAGSRQHHESRQAAALSEPQRHREHRKPFGLTENQTFCASVPLW